MEHAGNYAMNCDGIWCLFHPFFRTASASAILGAACRVDIDNAELDSARFDHFECVPLCVSVCVRVCVRVSTCVWCVPSPSLVSRCVFDFTYFLSTPISHQHSADLMLFMYIIFYVMYVALCATSVEADVHNLRVTILMKNCLFFGGVPNLTSSQIALENAVPPSNLASRSHRSALCSILAKGQAECWKVR